MEELTLEQRPQAPACTPSCNSASTLPGLRRFSDRDTSSQCSAFGSTSLIDSGHAGTLSDSVFSGGHMADQVFSAPASDSDTEYSSSDESSCVNEEEDDKDGSDDGGKIPQPFILDAHHPFTKFKDQLATIAHQDFLRSLSTSRKQGSQTSTSPPPPPSPRALERNKPESSTPASRHQIPTPPFDIDDTTDSEDESIILITETTKPPPPPKAPQPISTPPLACPFYLRSPKSYRCCLTQTHLHNASDLRQHITTAHARPEHCPTCYATFPSEVLCTIHIRSRSCTPNPHAAQTIRGAPQYQIRQIARMERRANSARTKEQEQQWFAVWDALFPDAARPGSARLPVGDASVRAVCAAREYWAREGRRVVLGFLERRGVEGAIMLRDERGLEALRDGVGELLIERVLGEVGDE
ncbi:hypothetical protein B0T19DRAFT_445574 [Cercophora scortea]|uniref:Uncharacterized protein n=1 Tax=Cercophora scortea TaxID=314031 RepID=A0AAE0I781_9PEZI|nr:hypothetical protein B0T19DRAFT_445574 [Cercophora scortea]